MQHIKEDENDTNKYLHESKMVACKGPNREDTANVKSRI